MFRTQAYISANIKVYTIIQSLNSQHTSRSVTKLNQEQVYNIPMDSRVSTANSTVSDYRDE